jgi:hypothetical protein
MKKKGGSYSGNKMAEVLHFTIEPSEKKIIATVKIKTRCRKYRR